MTDEKIREMLKNIVLAIDYDIYKEMFEFPEDSEMNEIIIEDLIDLIKGYVHGQENDI